MLNYSYEIFSDTLYSVVSVYHNLLFSSQWRFGLLLVFCYYKQCCMNICGHVSFCTCVSVSLGYQSYLGVELARGYVHVLLYQVTLNCFP